MQLSVGPPLAGVCAFFDGTIRRGDKRQPYTNSFRRLSCTKWFEHLGWTLSQRPPTGHSVVGNRRCPEKFACTDC